MKDELKRLVRFLGLYGLLIGFIFFLRIVFNQPIDFHYYAIISSFVIFFIVVFAFIKPHHIERVLPEDWKITQVISLALTLEPLMERRIQNIKEAQEARGANFRGFGMIRGYISLLVPSIIQTLRWSDTLSESLKIRGADTEEGNRFK